MFLSFYDGKQIPEKKKTHAVSNFYVQRQIYGKEKLIFA